MEALQHTKEGITEKEKKALQVIEKVLEGSTLKQALKDSETSASSFYETLSTFSWLSVRYGHAKEVLADIIASEIVNISDTATDHQKARNQIDARKWLASKYKHREYGDKLTLDGQNVVDLSGALNAGKLRAQRRIEEKNREKDITDAVIVEEVDKTNTTSSV